MNFPVRKRKSILLIAITVLAVVGLACSSLADSQHRFEDDSPGLTSNQPFELSAIDAGPAPENSTRFEFPVEDLANVHEITVDPQEYRQLLPRDAIAPVYDPQFISGFEAGLSDDELVIGVHLNGESKAYPVGPLTRREMVNDVVGGVPVLVTW